MRALLALVFALPACGRMGFDLPASDAPAGGDAPSARDAPALVPCERTGLTCVGAASGVQLCNGRCFSYCNEVVTRSVATARCEAWSGELTSISMDERFCVADLATNDAWIGLTQQAGAAQPTDGWTWLDGTATVGLPWATGEPTDGDGVENGEEQCAIQGGGGVLLDLKCDDAKPFVCERPAPP